MKMSKNLSASCSTPYILILLLALFPFVAQAQFLGAKWIGTEESVLYSDYLPVFRLSWDMQLDKESGSTRAAMLFGANDPRLMNRNMNVLGVEAAKDESYIRVELDATDMSDSTSTAVLKMWRVGYTQKGEELISTFQIPSITNSTLYDKHHYEVVCNLGNTTLFVDGKSVGKCGLNPMGNGGDYIAFPVLGNVGYEVRGGQRAVFSMLKVANVRSPYGTLYQELDSVIVSGTKETTVKTRTTVKSQRSRGRSRRSRSRTVTKVLTSQKVEEVDTRIFKDISHGGMPILTTLFQLKNKPVTSAFLNVTARGIYNVTINGQYLSNEYFAPGISQYNKTHYYQTYNARKALSSKYYANEKDTLSISLAEGWWAGGHTYTGDNWNHFGDQLACIARLVVKYQDGDSTVVVTDPDTWTVRTNGPTRYASMFQGEVIDRNYVDVDMTGVPAQEMVLEGHVPSEGGGTQPKVNDYSAFRFVPANTTVNPFAILQAQSVTKVSDDVYIYDMGQNMAGVPHIILRDALEPGTRLTFRYAEVLYPNLPQYGENVGKMMLENIRAAMAQDIYIAGKESVNVFSPRNTLHGYRYVEISGLKQELPLEDVQGIVLSSVNSFTADFKCSNPLVNRLWKNIQWSMLANFISMPTDCPQRNERMGWSGDISVFSRTATNMADVDAFLRKHMQAMRDVQTPEGRFPDIAPVGGGFGGLLWGSAGITVPWECWLQYADKEILLEHYDAMKAYIKYVDSHYFDPQTGLLVQERQWGDLGDWLCLEDQKNDKSLLFESYYIYDLDIMRQTAKILGKDDDAARYEARMKERKQFFVKTFIDPSTGKTKASAFNKDRVGQLVDNQGSYVLPLAFGIVDDDTLRQKMVDNLVATIERKNTTDDGKECPSYSLMTGFITTAWISRVLSDNGRSDVAYRLLLNESFPSWLYPVTQGATTIWERLNACTDKDGFGSNNSMNSFNHYSFGAVGQWLINRTLGIERDEKKPGFKHFYLRPEVDPTKTLTYAKGHLDTKYGRIESQWYYDEKGRLKYEFVIPNGTTATLLLPGKKPKTLKSGRHLF